MNFIIRPNISLQLKCKIYIMSQADVLSINYDQKLGHGVYGIVYKGTFEGENVAVKRTPLFCITDLITRDEYIVRIRHPNLVVILHITRDDDFRFTFMELCATSLDQQILKIYNGPMPPSDEQVLLQLANGLGYLHSLNILHGDIKPENILISLTLPVQMKWTGFGFRQKKGSCSLSLSGSQLELRKWWPPEMYLDERNASEKGDIFSVGCIFFYFLSTGIHPFGSAEHVTQIVSNVQMGSPVNLKDLSSTNFHFIEAMIVKDPLERIPLWDVINILEIQQRPNLNNPFQFPLLPYVERVYLNGYFSRGLFFSKFHRLAVKRIPLQYCSLKTYGELRQLNISNVVRILHFEKIGGNLFYGMEFCVASLDHCFPTKDRGKLYEGPMPSHEQFFFQLVTGLQYIHEKNLVHGSIKPSNLLIYSENEPQIKLSDFGLTFPRLSGNISSTETEDGFQSDRYWMAPELWNKIFEKFERKHSVSIFKPKKGDDIFSIGKIFFYYYFQTYTDVIRNASSQNAFKKLPMMSFCKIRNDHYPIQLYTEMFEKESRSRLQLKDVINRVINYQLTSKGELNKPKDETLGKIQFSRDHILGKGGQAVVHLGLWNGSIVAIKRINARINRTPEVTRELGLQHLNHPNIVKFFGFEKDNDFMYIAIERCLISLNDYCRQRHLYQGVIPMRSNKEVLLQLAEGLQYIHSQHLTHGDVKPGNILISSEIPANIKFVDFGLSKSVQKNGMDNQSAVDWSFLQGTEGWMAPEVIVNCEGTKHETAGQKCDVFALGCVFFYFLVPACHPFGNNRADRRKNVLIGEPTNLNKLSAQTSVFKVIIQGMIEHHWQNRTEIVEVVRKLQEVTQFEIEMCALTENSSQLSIVDDRPNPKRPKFD